MTKKQILTERKRVTGKMLAATSMLLISALLLVTSSYAWITLSVSPEVKDIDTLVAANGYLEVALQSYDGSDGAFGERAAIGSGRGTSRSVAGVVEANKTWGNIVDLNTEAYGLSGLTLVPTRLNVETSNNDWVNKGNMLLVPSFGFDGRMKTLDPVGYCYYDGEQEVYIQGTTYGVRVIGRENELNVEDRQVRVDQYDRLSVVSQMATRVNSDREQLKSDLRDVFSYKENGVDNAHDILTMLYYGVANRGDFGDTEQQTWDAVNRIVEQCDDVVKDAAVSMRYALMARASADMVSFPDGDDEANARLAAIFQNYQDYSLTDIENLAVEFGWTDIEDAVDAIKTCARRVTNAKECLYDDSGDPRMTYLANAVIHLINPASGNLRFAEMNCLNVNDLEEYLSMTIFDDYYDGNYPEMVYMGGNRGNYSSGLFADMAAVVGDYSAEMFDINYLDSDAVQVEVYATTETSRDDYSEEDNVGCMGIVLKTAQRANVSGDITITTTMDATVTAYGYAIDLAFRCCENGTLMLRQDAVDRVTGEAINSDYDELYGENTVRPRGGGSNLTFKYAGSMSADQIDALMENVYVIFLDTDTGAVLGGASAGTPVIDSSTLTVTASLQMKRVYISGEGLITLGQSTADQKIKTLAKDVPSYVTAVIYLNGDGVSSGVLAADQGLALEGSINLQFETDALLHPSNVSKYYD
ncbi:MAG: hypothetical protein IKN38_07730 [Clostridia bacterium]|nr:hypothetical protein [Clostridia bacterium]